MLAAGDISRPEKCGGDSNLESRSLASGLVVRPGATLDEIFSSNLGHRCILVRRGNCGTALAVVHCLQGKSPFNQVSRNASIGAFSSH